MIKAIIFDFFGVICSDEYWRFVKEDKNVASDFGQLANAVNIGSLTWNDFIAIVAKQTGHEPTEVRRLYEAEKIHPGLLAYISMLHKDYKTGLLTNAHYEFLDPIIDKANLNTFFDAIVLSSRVGVIKPQAAIYQAILDKLGVEAEEAVFIDDISRNVEAAQAIGMRGLLFQSFRQLQADLPKMLNS